MSRTTGLMWPRDFLGEDLPAARVMTYGYNTRLSSNKLDRFEDFCTQFLQSVLLARDFPEVRFTVLTTLRAYSWMARAFVAL
jgi:hypothetical protein